jgi:hypothetical protein
MKKTAFIVFIAGVCAFNGCSNPAGPAASIYSMSFSAGAPVNKNYSKSYVYTDTQSVMQTNTQTLAYVYNFVGWGQCSCGAETPQAYLICDTLNGTMPYDTAAKSYIACDSTAHIFYSPRDTGDYGNFAIKIVGDETEPFVHGSVKINSFTKTVDKIIVAFSGYILVNGDTVQITNGQIVAPAAPAPSETAVL